MLTQNHPRSSEPTGLVILLWLAGGLVTVGQPAKAEPHVEASLHVPPAEAYVLGDEVPLLWRFTNRSSDPLAMLWEGCCRLNGKLDVRAADESLEVLPPGASTFHTYSKAETLPPDQTVEFQSRLADWVSLPRGGEFELAGRYTGVLPIQTPQVPDGVALWRGTATAAPTQIQLLDVADYLAQRPGREQRRQLALRLPPPAGGAP
ncbi:MAG TPA: hypothetical protein DCY13_17225, partial [Verrucomicrobiales bacterium]|nr:hypothetical protein [Verrucomicrobiales bacterium]